MKNIIPYGKQNITDEDIQEVIKTLKSTNLTQGPKILEFEKDFSKYIGCKYAVAVANGTAALHLSAIVLNVKKGSKVITTPITFAASANCVRYCGGEVVFADIDPDTYLLDINSVRSLLKSSPKGTYAGIVVVDFAGRSVNLEEYQSLAEEYECWIIEDACHSPGGYFIDKKGKKQNCGNGFFSDVAIFSFHPVKHIACGEGGMITTNNEKIYLQLLRLRSHGITKGDDSYVNKISFASSGASKFYPGWYMEMQQLGYNYRLTDIQASLGITQLKKASNGLKRRKEIAVNYYKAFKNKSFIISQSGVVDGHAYHLYIIEVENRLNLYNYLHENNISPQIHYIPCHLMPYYRDLGYKEGDFVNSETYYKYCISLPMYPTLKEEEQNYVIERVLNFFE